MNILMTSTSYPADESDWRGVFIRHLSAGIAGQPGVSLRLWAPPGALPKGVAAAATPTESTWLGQLMQAGGVSHLMRKGGWQGLTAPLRLLRMLASVYRRERDVDLYHVNWLQCALPLPANGKPVVVSVLGNDLKLLGLPGMRALLRRRLRGRRVAICPNAEWMAPILEAAFGDIARIVPVSFGVDERWFAIHRAPLAPARWVAVTRLTANKLGPLFAWGGPLFDGAARELHLFGPMQETIDVPGWVHYHGSASPELLATQWYPGVQGLITLSEHAEGRPQAMLEAMAAALPIIASDMPAHASIVADGETGLLCSDPRGFAAAVEALEDPGACARFGEAARQRARAAYGDWHDAGQRYLRVYESLLEQRP